MSLTNDRNDPDLGVIEPSGMQKAYLVLSDEELEKGYVRPVRQTYVHSRCHHETTMALRLAETYAREPTFYDGTFCANCGSHFPVAEFRWAGTDQIVGS